MNVNDVISHYVGKVIMDKLHIECHAGIKDWLVEGYKKERERDKIVLAALKCAKSVGFSGEK